MNDIFISYASNDRETAQKFADSLEGFGWSVWWDREIPVGKTYDQVIEEELNAARCVLVLWSKHSVVSRWVKTEASAAADRENLVPVLIDKVAIPLEFRRIQTAILPDWNGDKAHPEFVKLREAIEQMVSRGPAGTVKASPLNASISPIGRMSRRSPAVMAGSVLVLVLLIAVGVLAKRLFRSGAEPAQSQSAA